VGDFSSGGVDYALIEEMSRSSWASVAANAPENSILNSVAAASANDIWTVGYYSVSGKAVPLIEHWDGSAWAQVATPSLNGYLNGVFAVGNDDAWAVGVKSTGNGYVTLIEHWDGSSWSVVPSPNGAGDNWLNAVAGDSASSIWAVGWQGGGYHKTLAEYWDGVDWRIVPTPSPGSSTNVLQDMVDVSASDVWAVGYTGGSRRSTLAERWNGSAWQTVTTPNAASQTNQLIGVGALGVNDVWAVGEYYQGGWKSLAENWNGQSWKITTSPNPMTGNEVNAVTVLPDASAWSVGESGSQSLSRQLCPAEITDSGFLPTRVSDWGWQTVAWITNPSDLSHHTVSDGTGMGLFDSGPLSPRTAYSFTFFSSGTYLITDRVALKEQAVEVPMSARPSSGTTSSIFTLRWASRTAPFGYVYDVQIKLPGAAQFIPFATGVSTSSTQFTPSSGPGTYQFQARLRNSANGFSSSSSPSLSISVSP